MGEVSDPHPIHTKCIAKHWQNHANGISAGRCHEFAKKMSRSGPCGGRTWAAIIKGNTP